MASGMFRNDEQGREVSINQLTLLWENVLERRSGEGRSPSKLNRVEELEARIDNE
jgi:hypothetical protein